MSSEEVISPRGSDDVVRGRIFFVCRLLASVTSHFLFFYLCLFRVGVVTMVTRWAGLLGRSVNQQKSVTNEQTKKVNEH